MKQYLVEVIESERGWGQRVDERKYFSTEAEARDWVSGYNSKNTAPSAPDWYMRADYCGLVNTPTVNAKPATTHTKPAITHTTLDF